MIFLLSELSLHPFPALPDQMQNRSSHAVPSWLECSQTSHLSLLSAIPRQFQANDYSAELVNFTQNHASGCHLDIDVGHHAIYWLIPDFYPSPPLFLWSIVLRPPIRWTPLPILRGHVCIIICSSCIVYNYADVFPVDRCLSAISGLFPVLVRHCLVTSCNLSVTVPHRRRSPRVV